MIDKSKKNEAVKSDSKKMPDKGSSEKVGSEKSIENQTPNKFSHRPNKEETYEPKRTEVPKVNKR